MDIRKLDHIGIVVEDLEAGKKKYSSLGLRHLHDETVEEFNSKIAFFACGDILIELIEPTAEGDGTEFLRTHGEGLNHLCYEVGDIQEALAEAQRNGMTDYVEPRTGAGGSRVFFMRADSCCGVTTEFVQKA